MINLNDVDMGTQTTEFALIPDKTPVRAIITINMGDTVVEEFSSQPLFKKSSTSVAKWLPFEFYIHGGQYDQRKIWYNLFVDGPTINPETGVSKSREIGIRTLRKMVDSIHGLKASDVSAEAIAKRESAIPVESLMEKEFCFLVGIEKGTEGYSDKNRMIVPLTPDDTLYIPSMGSVAQSKTNLDIQQPRNTSAPSNGNIPSWAK